MENELPATVTHTGDRPPQAAPIPPHTTPRPGLAAMPAPEASRPGLRPGSGAGRAAGPPAHPPGGSRGCFPPYPGLTRSGRSRLSRAAPARPRPRAEPPLPPAPPLLSGMVRLASQDPRCPKATWPPRRHRITLLPFAAILSEGRSRQPSWTLQKCLEIP